MRKSLLFATITLVAVAATAAAQQPGPPNDLLDRLDVPTMPPQSEATPASELRFELLDFLQNCSDNDVRWMHIAMEAERKRLAAWRNEQRLFDEVIKPQLDRWGDEVKELGTGPQEQTEDGLQRIASPFGYWSPLSQCDALGMAFGFAASHFITHCSSDESRHTDDCDASFDRMQHWNLLFHDQCRG